MKTNWLLSVSFFLFSISQAWADVEFFLRVNDGGRYTVSLDDQTITLSKGRFRFFDVPPGRQRLVISRNNTTVYQDWIDLRNDQRTVAEFTVRRGVRIVSTYPLFMNGRYTGPEWEQNQANNYPDRPNQGRTDWPDRTDRDRPNNGSPDWNTPNNGPIPPGGNPNRPNPQAPQTSMSRFEFDQLRSSLTRESYDERKFELIRNVLPNRAVSTAQVADLLRQFSFDKYRLESAKIAWNSVTDQQNFYTVFDTFSFESTKRDLKKHIGWQ